MKLHFLGYLSTTQPLEHALNLTLPSQKPSFLPKLGSFFELSRGSNGQNVKPMEGLRGFAVFLVFLVHYTTLAHPWIGRDTVTEMISRILFTIGNSGVDLFFVLSGYLIFGSLISRPQLYFHFLRRRAERIYPTFVVVFMIYILMSYVYPAQNRIPNSMSGGFFFLLQNILLLPGIFQLPILITVAWSLSYEMAYYLIAPLIVKLFGMQSMSPVGRVATLLGIATLGLAYFITFGGPIRLMLFLAGAVLFEVKDGDLIPVPRSLLAIVAFVIGLSILFVPVANRFEIAGKISALAIGLFFLCHHCFTRQDAMLARAFSWTPLRWLGNMSYSYYLIHGLTLKAAFLFIGSTMPVGRYTDSIIFWILLPPMFVLTLSPSALLFLTVERRFSLGKKKTEVNRAC